MKSFLILIILNAFIGFSSQEDVNLRVARNFFFRRYLGITDDKKIDLYIADDFKHTLCSGEVVSRDKGKIMEDVKRINDLRRTVNNKINVENAFVPGDNQLSFDVRDKLTENELVSTWLVELRGPSWKFVSRKDKC